MVIDREQLKLIVKAVLDDTYCFWDGYYLPRGDVEVEKYVEETTSAIAQQLEKVPMVKDYIKPPSLNPEKRRMPPGIQEQMSYRYNGQFFATRQAAECEQALDQFRFLVEKFTYQDAFCLPDFVAYVRASPMDRDLIIKALTYEDTST